jgi:glucokinase
MIMDPNGPECGCSQRGCLEVYASASNVARIAKEEANKEGVQSALTGKGIRHID